ncbi:3-dehydroquinate synthase [Saliterribacillus persicus]|uniref:3-dehydroquinate synthase n=1 Tax=Saliterribacillus persicus TaxID=930114 RepID=A0A368XCG1_9BACI|nr:3-dehydroquinate synthase [Saliterribacillus persicus]RCW64916.1 3-dehydroquinate synthase [Saliterribacillus persicus]
MHTEKIQTNLGSYRVHVASGLRFNINQLIEKEYKRILLITDSTVDKLYADDISKGFDEAVDILKYVVPSGEASKNIEEYYRLLTYSIENNMDRHSLIIALGGGMIGDLSGFVASTFMRGIDFIQVPTTILAHDSSVGGKVAINHPEGKNLIGSFYPPVAVVYDVDTLHSLPSHEIRSGYAEVIKHGFIANGDLLKDVLHLDIKNEIENTQLIRHLCDGIKVKANIVEKDEKESSIRKFLNFGHTLGHAIESEMGYGNLTHGEAVAIGMLFALEISEEKFNVDLFSSDYQAWMDFNHYPIKIGKLNLSHLIKRMKKDKKAKHAIVQMVLLENIGKPILVDFTDEELSAYLDKFLRKLGSN